ncbi:MAG: hypothetical protein WCD69_25075, partial [Xanthobacteraceae bacterium]
GNGVVIAWPILITISAFGLIRIKVRLPTVVQVDVKADIEFGSSSARGAFLAQFMILLQSTTGPRN